MTSCQTDSTHRLNLRLPDEGQDMWLKHVGVVYNKYKKTVQLVGGQICVYWTDTQEMYNIKYSQSYSIKIIFQLLRSSTNMVK